MRSIGHPRPVSSALVIEFPLRAAARERLRMRVRTETEPATPVFALCGGGWYHEEAIEEDRLRREREGSTSH